MSLPVQQFLEPGGLLDQKLERYEFRPQQVQMAKMIADALEGRHAAIVEAATGTGKTLAYLIPALLSRRRVVVSTGTKALQEQLFFKDIPFLQEHLPRNFKAVLLKGRRNYLCKQRFEEMERKPAFRSADDVRLWPVIRSWAGKTSTGDRAEIEGLPDNYPTWQELSVGSEGCLGTKCPYYDECFVNRVREDAQEADVIVVNHHLFFADLALRQTGFAEILPSYDAVVFDEAHHLESVATEYFGLQVSNFRFWELAGDVERAVDADEVSAEAAADVLETTRHLTKAAGQLFDRLLGVLREGRHGLDVLDDIPERELIDEALEEVYDGLDDLEGAIRAVSALGESGQRLAQRCKELSFELKQVIRCDNPRYAYIVERRDRGVFLQAAPIDLASLMRRKLLDTHDALVFTSATLATGGNFEFFKRRMGMLGFEREEGPAVKAVKVEELILEPVFDYPNQCVLYVPNKLPAPNDPNFCDNVALIVDYLLKITEGRAFVLFTSYMNMNAVHDLLVDKIDYPVLLQGQASKREILEKFRATPNAVLFATSSFWEGVDVEGEALSMVIIDKLPFANPSDPLTRARLDLVDERGGNSFAQISLPSAAISLKQGFGRLIRSKSDVGVVAILDSRVAHKSYGRYFLNSLPPAPVVWSAPAVKRWWYQRHPELLPEKG
ncbi:helicase [Lujinxingia litoralis]|uniref:DNA 5'-3' helicase n=1 Tax=Lujinxingia litoralis TaxID=2211119 RepID=A0A328C8Y7_9DELT|nr:ATP-dependent DNA helicase [Lujinxingia litoralis]RAL22385.1 helicase [Lujinxingia litoralis]